MASQTPTFHEAARQGFGAAVIEAYEKGRPEHPVEFVFELLKRLCVLDSNACTENGRFPSLPLLEVGCGTGKYTRPLFDVLKSKCVDSAQPNLMLADPADMTEKLRKDFPDLVFLKTPAHDLSALPDGSVGAIICAQAFHWFSDPVSVAELLRVLQPGGHFAVVWNLRDPSFLDGRFESLLDRFYFPDTPRQQSGAWKTALQTDKLGSLQHQRVSHSPDYEGDEEQVLAYVLSISDVSKRAPHEKDDIARQFQALLRHPDTPTTVRESDGKRVYRIPMFVDMYWAQKL